MFDQTKTTLCGIINRDYIEKQFWEWRQIGDKIKIGKHRTNLMSMNGVI